MSAKKIAVLMGGPSSEAEVSRRSGAAAIAALRERGYIAEGVELRPGSFMNDIQATECDMVFNAVHGAYGEDGRIQAALELLGIPCTGSGVLASALTMDKVMAKSFFIGAKISTPRARTFFADEDRQSAEQRIVEEFSVPVVVKAPSQGSSIGVVIATSPDAIPGALDEAFKYGNEALVEEFIDGKELTVAVLGAGDTAEVLPIIEIETVSGRYDYESKYTVGASRHIIPARISESEARRVREIALKTFVLCGCGGVARVDIMLGENGTPYVIDVNTVPGMTETSLVPDAARAAGIEFPELCERLLKLTGF